MLLDLLDASTARQVLALQRMAYRIEADLIGFDEIPPLQENQEELQACKEVFFGVKVGQVLVGAIAHARHDDVVEIGRLMVHPGFFRQGLATSLLLEVEQAHLEARVLRVATGSLNIPARRLYETHGFLTVGTLEVGPGVFMTVYEKHRGSPDIQHPAG
ncbi:MAG: GNAT family N-acetyltransferase [bacterium]|nr:GNAT family N-acetyltransferase [bacterium]